jgi:hypothetical protein
VAILALVAVLAVLQSDYKEEYGPFVEAFVEDYSVNWEIGEVRERVANELLLQIQTPNGVQAVAFFKRLGPLREISDLTVERFFAGTSESSVTFSLKAEFEHAPAVVTVGVQILEGQPLVQSFHVNPLSDPPLLGSNEADI